MEGTFNKHGTRDYHLFLTEEEATLLLEGEILSGELQHHWNKEETKILITVSLVPDQRFRQIVALCKKDKTRGTWQSCMFSVGVLKNPKQHMMYLNCTIAFKEELGGKVFSQRYCEHLSDKVFIFVPYNPE